MPVSFFKKIIWFTLESSRHNTGLVGQYRMFSISDFFPGLIFKVGSIKNKFSICSLEKVSFWSSMVKMSSLKSRGIASAALTSGAEAPNDNKTKK
jgi:hypothetical protein